MGALRSRMAQELKLLQQSPPPGVCAWPVEDRLNHLQAQVSGPAGTVYEGGVFTLSVMLPDRYPFEPPKVRFETPVYHPNIDNGGRICLDILNMPPKGAWRPSLNISTVLASIGLLLGEPNPDDGLVTDVTHEYKHSREAFDAKARAMTREHARVDNKEQPLRSNNGPGIDAPTGQSLKEASRGNEARAAEGSFDDGSSSSSSDDEGPPSVGAEKKGEAGPDAKRLRTT